MNHKIFLSISCIFILSIGIIFRFHNISQFKVYPDSYQSLLVAENIRDYHDVIGFLGKNGMQYPDFFTWTHPMYPVLILFFNLFIKNISFAAYASAFIAGILAIPLTFFCMKRIFNAVRYGYAGAFLLAFSFQHTIWSGFIMTETTGVLFMLLFLLIFFSIPKKKIGTAGFFCLAVLTRYEYSTILLPAIFFHLFPKRVGSKIIAYITNGTRTFLWVFSLFIIFQVLIDSQNIFLQKDFAFIRYFAVNDVLLSIFSIIGIMLMLKSSVYRKHGFFVLFSSILLTCIYHHVNPDMERYMTHLIPFLLIPASFGLINVCIKTSTLLKSKIVWKKIVGTAIFLCIFMLILYQGYLTYNGLRYIDDPIWFQTSYEEKAATLLKKYISNKNYLLITSMPEPYYFVTNMSTQSISDMPPFLFIDNAPKDQQVLIIEDMGMRKIFPNFTNFLTKYVQNYKTAQFWVHKRFYYIDGSQKEITPVTLYRVPLGELENKIKIRK